MNKTFYPHFNHKITLLGGQSFSWDLIDAKTNLYVGFTDRQVIKLKIKGDYIYWQTYPNRDDWDFINNYFQINQNYINIIKCISNDKFVYRAISNCPNIRILRQPFDFTVLTFIISANKNIASIRKCTRAIAKAFGKPVDIPGIGKAYTFPSAAVLRSVSEKSLRKTGVGFRAKYLKKTSENLALTKLSKKVHDLPEDKLRHKLMGFYGIGSKIADCILVFSLGYTDVTPIDIWMKRILINLYGLSPNLKYEQYREWMKPKFGIHSAYAGQFLFEWYRNSKTMPRF